jgi:RNA polymerase sigma-70 factor (ECF subfamily)
MRAIDEMHKSTAKKLTEAEYIANYRRSQDQSYLSDLYRPYMTLIYGTCLKYLQDVGLAEDAVMDIYIGLKDKVLKHEINNFSAWVYRISVNHCLEQLRTDKRYADRKNEAEDMYSAEIFHPNDVDKEKDLQIMEACMLTLSDTQLQCVKHFYYEKKSYQDIAGMLSMSYTQVRSAIQNGRRNIKNCMTTKMASQHEG